MPVVASHLFILRHSKVGCLATCTQTHHSRCGSQIVNISDSILLIDDNCLLVVRQFAVWVKLLSNWLLNLVLMPKKDIRIGIQTIGKWVWSKLNWCLLFNCSSYGGFAAKFCQSNMKMGHFVGPYTKILIVLMLVLILPKRTSPNRKLFCDHNTQVSNSCTNLLCVWQINY